MYYPCDTHKENNCVFSKIYIIKICKETNKDDFVFFFFSLILLLYSINVHSVSALRILQVSSSASVSSLTQSHHHPRQCAIAWENVELGLQEDY